MQRIQRILHPTDFSPGAEHALAFTLETSVHWGADLHVLHVVYGGREYWDRGEETIPADALLETHLRELVDLQAKSLSLTLPANVSFEIVAADTPAEGILQFSKDRNVDLIVMGSHGRRGMGKLIMGSVAARVLRSAHCDVVTLSRRASSGKGRVVIAVDLHERSAELVRHGLELAAALGTGADLLHVLEPVGVLGELELIEAYVAPVGSTLRQVAADRLLDLITDLDPGTDVAIYVERGKAAEEILKYVAANDSRLLVTASAGMTPEERIRRDPTESGSEEDLEWWLGKITERIVSYSPVPVWVVKRFTDKGGYFTRSAEDSWLEDELDITTAGGSDANRNAAT